MDIVMKPVGDLIPYINNPRHNDQAVDAVASSIKNFGFKVPIVVDAKNEIINGHTRLKAAKKLGMKKVPTIVADDLSPEQIKEFRLADNKVSELAEWDEDLLAIELEELENLDFDMSEFGFDDLSKYEGDIDELFFESEEQAVKDSVEYLKWGNSKAWLSEDGNRLLDDLFKKYKIAVTSEEIEFVQWLLNREGDFDEVDVS